MAKVEAVSAAPPTMLKDTRRKSTEKRVEEPSGPSLAEMRRRSASITELINNAPLQESFISTRRSKPRKFSVSKLQQAPPPNTWRRRARQVIKYPHATLLGRIRHYGILAAIVLNFFPMIMETLDGPANGGSDPKYPRLPSATSLFYMDVVFTGVSALDFGLRWVIAKRQRKFWTQIVTWIDVLGLMPLVGVLVMKYALHWTNEACASVEQYLKLLRHFRIVRVTYMLRNISGIRVLHATFLECIHPLQITLFFLVTFVMTLATLLYYAQPCYDATKCTFTDIVNTSYYVMVTVATVGYGDQVPDLTNPLAVLIAITAMIFGALYLAMPFAIIGIKYELTWRRFENVSRTTRSTLELRAALKAVTIQPLHPKTNYVNVLMFDAIEAITRLGSLVEDYINTPDTAFFTRDDALNAAFLDVHAAGDKVIQRFHSLLRHLAPFLPPDFDFSIPQKAAPRTPLSTPLRGMTLTAVAGDLLAKAKRATMVRMDTPINLMDPNLTFRRRLRFHLRATSHGSWANRLYLSSILLSVAVFYAESVPELQAFGPTTHLCHVLMESYCHANPSPAANPGCYVWQNATSPAEPSIPVQFYCDERDNGLSTSDCFGVGFNFGGNKSTMKCAESFAQPAKVCNLRECQRGHEPILDLTHHWIYVEVYLGIAFTVELSLRVYVSNHRRRLLRSPSTWIDILAILPFYAQTVAGVSAGRMPMYVSSPAFPTFLSVLPILKTIRIVKLGWYFEGSTVLAQTAALTYERLATPLFFLFFACGTAGAIFFEIERGTACYAGLPCIYMKKDLMTAKIAQQFPHGKRIQIQLDSLAKLKDMWRTTWMAAVTLTGVGFGDLTPRTPVGRLLSTLTMVFGSCYTAMPLSLVGGQFYQCYEHYHKAKHASLEGGIKVSPSRTSDPLVNTTPKLPPPACDRLRSLRTIVCVVDTMMCHLYKLNRARPSPVVLPIPLEASLPPLVVSSSAFALLSSGTSLRQTLVKRIAPVGPPPPDKLVQCAELRRLIREASAVVTTMGLHLPRVVETIVEMTPRVQEKTANN